MMSLREGLTMPFISGQEALFSPCAEPWSPVEEIIRHLSDLQVGGGIEKWRNKMEKNRDHNTAKEIRVFHFDALKYILVLHTPEQYCPSSEVYYCK